MTDAQQANGNQPESQNQAEATAQPHNKRVTKWVAIVIAIVAVAIIAAVAVFGTRAYSASQYDSAVAACAAASEDVRNATNDYNNLVNGDAAEAAALTKADVSDASALDALSKELADVRRLRGRRHQGLPGRDQETRTAGHVVPRAHHVAAEGC